MNTHATDKIATERIVASVLDRNPDVGVTVVSHEEHPYDARHSLTTIVIAGRNTARVFVYATWRDNRGGNIEMVSRSCMNAAA